MRHIALALAMAALSAVPTVAQRAPLRAELLHQQEWLDEQPDWMASTVSLGRTGRNQFGWFLSAGRFGRFDQVDAAGAAQIWLPLTTGTMIELGAEGSPSTDFLPEWGATIGIQQELGAGWVASARATRRRYSVEDVDLGALGIEYYFDLWRVAYRLGAARGTADETGYAHSFTASRYFGETGSLNGAFSAGREVETVGQGRAVILDVRAFDIWGTAPVGGPIALLFGGGYSDHETLGSRYRGQLGLRVELGL